MSVVDDVLAGRSPSTDTSDSSSAPNDQPKSLVDSVLSKSSPDTLQASLKASGNISPEQAAKVLRVKDQTGLPSSFVSRNLPQLETTQNATIANAADVQNQAPKVADWLAEDPHHAAVASHDIPVLSFLERQFSYMGNQAERGAFDIERSYLGGKIAVGLGTPEDEKRIEAIEKKLNIDLNQKAPGKVSNFFGKIVEGAPLMAGMIGAGTTAAALSVPAAGITAATAGVFGAAEFGSSYLDYRNRKDSQGNPISDTEAKGWATVSGVTNAAIMLALGPVEKIMGNAPGLRMLGKDGIDSILANPTARQAFQTYIKGIATSALSLGSYNGITSLVHSAAGTLAEMQNDKSLFSSSPMQIMSKVFTTDALKDAAESAGVGVATGGIFHGATGSIRFANDYRNAMKTQQSWQDIGEAVKSSKMSQMAPDQLEKVVSRIAPDQNVFIPMEKWQQYWADQKADPRTVFKETTGNTGAYDESMRTGTDLQIPASKYATTIAPSEHSEFFNKVLRSDPVALSAEDAEQGNMFHVEQEKTNEATKNPSLIDKGIGLVKGLFKGKISKASGEMSADDFIGGLSPEEKAAISKGRSEIQGGISTEKQFSSKSGNYTPERQAIHQEIVKSFDKPEAVAPAGTKPVATFVIGPPGSGKSTAIKQIPGNFVEIDNDDIKSKLPGFTPAKAALYHDESSHVEKMVMDSTVSKRMNFVLSAVGKTSEKFMTSIKDLKASGYDVDVVHFKMSPKDAAKSALQRYMGGGRYVDPDYVINKVGLKTEETYSKLKPEARNYEQYERSLEGDQKPQLRERNGRSGGAADGSTGRGDQIGSGETARPAEAQTALSIPLKEETNLKFTSDAVKKSLLAARIEQGTVPLFDDPKAVGMTPDQETRYMKAKLEAEQSASKQMGDKIRADQERIKNADRQGLRAEIEKEVGNQKEYIALDVLRARGDTATEYGMTPLKLSRSGIEDLNFNTKSLPRGISTEAGGMHPDQAAQIFGYRSGSEMLFSLINVPEKEQAIKDKIEERIQSKYGNPLDQDNLRNEAFKSIHNADRSRLLQLELQHLASDNFAAFKGMLRALTRNIPRLNEVRNQTKDMIDSKLAGDTKPYLYQRAESLAGREAREFFLQGDIEKAFEAKSRELLNHELFRAAQDAKEQTVKDVAFAARFDKDSVRAKLGKAGSDYLDQIDNIREKFDFAKESGKDTQRRQSLRNFVDEQQRQGYSPDIPAEILNESYRKSYREMTNQELHGVVDSMRTIDHLATLKNKLLTAQEGREYDDEKNEIIGSMTNIFNIKPEDLSKPINLNPSLKDKFVAGAENFGAWNTKMEFLFRLLDGGKYHGPAWENLFDPMNKAEDFKTSNLREAKKTVDDIFGVYSKSELKDLHSKLLYTPELEGSKITPNLNKMQILMTMLHWGNEGNRTELLRGYQWNESQVRSLWKHLDARDLGVANKIWTFVNSYWPKISEQQRRLNGIAPEKIEASPFEVQGKDGTVQMEGGYFPLVYDRNVFTPTSLRDNADDVKNLFGVQAGHAATKHGWTNERVGGGGQAPSLSITTFVNHVSDVIHDLAYREPVIDIYKLINDADMKVNIEAASGKEMYKQLNPWLKRIAGDRPWNPLGPIGDLLTKIQANATTAELGFKFTSAAIHTTSYLAATREVGLGYAVKGMKDFYSDMSGSWKFITDKSEFMKSRPEELDRDLRTRIASGKKLFNSPQIEAAAWAMMRSFDIGIAGPTWLAAYRRAMDGGVKNIEAGTEPDAIDYADQLVRDTKGSGASKDLSPILTAGGPLGKQFTMFLTQENLIANQFMQAAREYRIDRNIPKLIGTYAMVGFLPAAINELIRGRTPKDDESWVGWLSKDEALYPMAMVPGLRDVVGGWKKGEFETPAFEALGTLIRGAKATTKSEEWSDKDYSDALMSIGYSTGLPTRQAFRTAQYLHEWMTGEEQPDTLADGLYRTVVGRKSRAQ